MDIEKKPTLNEYIDSLETEHYRKWLKMFFSGCDYEEIGKETDFPASKVRLVMSMLLKQLPELDEDKYACCFGRYLWTESGFCSIMDTDRTVYNYLSFRYPKGKTTITRIMADPDIPEDAKERARVYLGHRIGLDNAVRIRSEKTASPLPYTPMNPKAFRRIKRKVDRSFDKKFYIGDIPIDDEEYAELVEYLTAQLGVFSSGMADSISDDPLLAVALVQIGVRRYDGGYWGHVGRAVRRNPDRSFQLFLGRSFINTLAAHNKHIYDDSKRVRSILFHCFVSDYYSRGLFDILFQYYVRDLERDINRNDRERMAALLEAFMRTSQEDAGEERLSALISGSKSKAYMLRKDTLNAISAQPKHSSVRLRRLLRLIDKAFWKDQVPANPTSRLTIRFKEWQKQSEDFNAEYKLYKNGGIRNRGKKHFSSPYLFSDIRTGSFRLILPSQIVSEQYTEDLTWKLRTSGRELILPVDTYPAVTGFKTEAKEFEIYESEIFGSIRCELVSADERVRAFPAIPADDVRFFDMEGDFANRLFKIPMCAYTEKEKTLESDALLDTVSSGNITRWDFEFENGDVVVLPSGKGMIVGERYSDGLTQRGRVSGAFYTGEENKRVDVYRHAPSLMLTLKEELKNGTAVWFGSHRYRLPDCSYYSFENGDSSGTKAIVLNCGQFGECRNDALNSVVIDAPNGAYAKKYEFVLIDGFNYTFADAPYVFTDCATVTFTSGVSAECINSGAHTLGDDNGYSFQLDSGTEYLTLRINNSITVDIRIPMLLWSVDGDEWQILPPQTDMWRTDFFAIKRLFIKYPGDSITLSVDADVTDDDDSDECAVAADRKGDIFVVDMSRLKSWMTRDRIMYNTYLNVDGTERDFSRVYVKSHVVSCDLSADYENGLLDFCCDVIGMADYYVDIVHVPTGTVIADKAALENGALSLPDRLRNGRYEVSVYESDDDDSGFEPELYKIYSSVTTLINKDDLSERDIRIICWKVSKNSGIYSDFSFEYRVALTEKYEKTVYTGALFEDGADIGLKVEVTFPDMDDLRYFSLCFFDDEYDELTEFMYDRTTRTLETEEAPGLHNAQKYLRYKMLFEDDCVFYGSIEDRRLPVSEDDTERN